MKLSVVIVSWNTCALLRACLDSVFAYIPRAAFEVFVVDNASSDGSPEMVAREFPRVRLIANRENRGFAGGNNQAIEQCSGEFILLLNPDTVVHPGALQTLVDHLDDHPGDGAAGARLLNPDGTLQESAYPRPTLLRELWRLFHLDRLRPSAVYAMAAWPVDRSRPVDVLKGAALMLRREALEDAGPLDAGYFMYSEEVDLCTRIQRAGWGLAWVPRAVVVHYEGQSTRQVAREMFLRLYEGKVRYFRQTYGSGTARAYKGVLFMAALGRLAVTPLAFIEPADRRRQHLSLSGYYRSLIAALPGF